MCVLFKEKHKDAAKRLAKLNAKP